MPTKLHPADPAGPRSQPARITGVRGRRLRTFMLAGLALGLLFPPTAVGAKPSAAELDQQIKKQGAALEKIIEDYNEVNEDLKKTTKAIERHTATLPGLQVQYADAAEEVSAIAATAYKAGQLREVNAMLTAGTDDSLLSRLGTLDHLARGRKAQIDAYTAAKQRYDAEKVRLDTAQAKQRIQARDLKARKEKIESDLKKLRKLRLELYGSEEESGSRYTGSIPAGSPTAVQYAYNAIGARYVAGGAGPYGSGYDCSGLTMAAWSSAGKSLPHNAAQQWGVVGHISRSQLQPGDLVFYSGLAHVAIYVGSGKIIHAPQPGEVVKLASVDMMAPYGFGRVR